MSKWVKFVDGATDIHWFPVERIVGMQIASANVVKVYVENFDQPTEAVSYSSVSVTDTGRAAAFADDLAGFLAGSKPGGSSVLEVKASGSGISGTVSVVDYNAGA